MKKNDDAQTPFWPVVEVSLSDPATVKVHGVSSPLTGDTQAAAVAVAADTARTLGYPVRMRVRSGTGVQCLVVDPLGVVTALRDDVPAVGRRFRR
jgi:hypothetical protein